MDQVHADLTAKSGTTGIDLTKVQRLANNVGVAFMGDTKGGPFDIPGDVARRWLQLPANPNGRPNADVLKPWMNGMDVTRRPSGKWIVDFGWELNESEAALYEEPFRACPGACSPDAATNSARRVSRLLVETPQAPP